MRTSVAPRSYVINYATVTWVLMKTFSHSLVINKRHYGYSLLYVMHVCWYVWWGFSGKSVSIFYVGAVLTHATVWVRPPRCGCKRRCFAITQMHYCSVLTCVSKTTHSVAITCKFSIVHLALMVCFTIHRPLNVVRRYWDDCCLCCRVTSTLPWSLSRPWSRCWDHRRNMAAVSSAADADESNAK